MAVLPTDRTGTGAINVLDDNGLMLYGPYFARGKADGQIAAAHGNPTRDPTLPDGDHPTGTYRVVAVERNKLPTHSYGTAFLLLDPIGGQALQAKENGRAGLAIHGGDKGPDGGLRSTEGCLRVSNYAAASLATVVEPELAAGRTVEYDCSERPQTV